MASTWSDLKIELIGTGDQSGTWGSTTNSNLGNDVLGAAIAGSADVTFSSADVTVTLTDSIAAQTARNLRLNLTGTTGGARNLILGSGCQIEKPYLINNGTADTITVKNTTGTGIAVPAGKSMWVYNNGTNVVDAVTHLTSLTLGSALPVASGGTGITSFGSGVATWLGTPSSANLASAMTDETGTGLLVFGTSPSLTTPKVITSINDTNGNELINVTATGSAVNEITVANAATGNAPTISATGGDTNIGITLTPKGTGAVKLSGLSYPTVDGSAGQAIVTNGSGTLSFATAGLAWQSVQTTGFTAVAGRAYPCNTTSATFTVTLPATPSAGNLVTLTDYAGTWNTNALRISPNGGKINGSTAAGLVNTQRGAINLVYVDSTQGWISYASNLATTITELISATGGDEVKTVGSYKYHIFTSSGTFTVTTGVGQPFEVMSCGGGGAGGYDLGGGGGSGELDLFTTVTASASAYTVTVGNAGATNTNGLVAGGTGGTSSFVLGVTTYTSSAGGSGGGGSSAAGASGNGSGGGGGEGESKGTKGAGTSNTNDGGNGANSATIFVGGGGGGATAVGAAASTSGSGAGGNGGAGYTLTSIDSNLTAANFTSFTGMTVICSGGGGGSLNTGGTPTRGVGGTGAGSGGVNNSGTVVNTSSASTSFGSGGGGGGWQGGSNAAATAGYAGVVIVRYLA